MRDYSTALAVRPPNVLLWGNSDSYQRRYHEFIKTHWQLTTDGLAAAVD
jgi:hypothetical protein